MNTRTGIQDCEERKGKRQRLKALVSEIEEDNAVVGVARSGTKRRGRRCE